MQSVIDPVCGMVVDPETAAGQSKFEGRDYYFCSVACKTEFDRNPGNYSHADGGRAGARNADDPPFTRWWRRSLGQQEAEVRSMNRFRATSATRGPDSHSTLTVPDFLL